MFLFFFFFGQDALDEEVHHASVFPRLGGRSCYFQDLISMFCVETFLFTLCFFALLELLVPTCIF